MTRWFVLAVCFTFLALSPGTVLAKRMGPKPVAPVEVNGVKFLAPNESGREGHIEAHDLKTGEKLWDALIYTVTIDPNLEEDVQWVFITRLEVKGDLLRVTNEKDQTFTLDPKTKQVKKLAAFIGGSGRGH
jgi:hypothetical protein